MRTNTAYLAAGVIALGLALPATAGAAQVSTAGSQFVALDAAPGEANRVTVTQTGDAVVIRDDGATLSVMPGADCTLVDAHQVRCPPHPVPVHDAAR